MAEDRDMTYSELVGLFDRLISLGVLHEDDVVMRFVQQHGIDFACPLLYTMKHERILKMVKSASPAMPDEDAVQFAENSSVKAVSEQIRSKHAENMDEPIGLLDFKDETKPESQRFGAYLTRAGLLHHTLQQLGKEGMIDGPEETGTAVFVFKVFNGKWIPMIAKMPEDHSGIRTIKIPRDIQEKLSVYMQRLNIGDVTATSLSAMDPDVVEFLEITRNPHLYDGQNALSGSQSVQ